MLWLRRDLNDHLVPTPVPWAGTLSTRPGCSRPCPAWPWTLPGRGQPQVLWAAWAGVLRLQTQQWNTRWPSSLWKEVCNLIHRFSKIRMLVIFLMLHWTTFWFMSLEFWVGINTLFLEVTPFVSKDAWMCQACRFSYNCLIAEIQWYVKNYFWGLGMVLFRAGSCLIDW